MGIGLHLVGAAAKRGLLGRVPSADRLLPEIEAWLGAEAREMVRGTRLAQNGARPATLHLSLHPAAEHVEIAASDDGRVTVAAITTGAGPGYHTYLSQLVRRLGVDLAIAWAASEAETSSGDDTAFFETDDRRSVERAMLGWLRGVMGGVRDARARGAAGIHVSLPTGRRFTIDGALATVLGERDDAWLERALRDPGTAIDVWPWWTDATDARYLLSRALCLMWTEVRWRPPGTTSEPELLDEVLGLLRRAHALDPDLPFPWREWAELLGYRGGSDPLGGRIAGRAAAADGPLVGYRRRPVTVVHEGWSVPIPGSFAERRTSEELWAGEAGRSLTLAAVVTGTDQGPMAPDVFLERFAGHLGGDALHHRRGPVVGKARLTVDPSSGVEVAVLEGYSAVVGSGAVIRIVIEDPADWEWALETWRALAHA